MSDMGVFHSFGEADTSEGWTDTYPEAYGEDYLESADAWGEWAEDYREADDPAAAMTTALRWTLHDDCGDASEDELRQALDAMTDAMSPAEAINFGRALSDIGGGMKKALSDPTVASIARTALPIVGGAVGTYFGGPIGMKLGSQLGTMAANALPGHAPGQAPARPPAPAPQPPPTVASAPATSALPASALPASAPPASAPSASALPALTLPASAPSALTLPASALPALTLPASAPSASAPPTSTPSSSAPLQPVASPPSTSPIAGGSAAAAQALVLARHPQMLQALFATALGNHGRTDVGGLPVAQLLGMLSQAIGQAAADADELRYLNAPADDAEIVWSPGDAADLRALYPGLIDADNVEMQMLLGTRQVGDL